MAAVHLTGRVVIDAEHEVSDAWVVGGQLTLERPATGADQTIEGFVFPGLVDVHCHVGVTLGGGTDQAMAAKQAEADRDTGVLLIRDAGSAIDTAWVHDRDDLPRLIRAGRFIARPKRYLRDFARELDDVSDLPRAAAEEARRGDGWVKLIADWIDRNLGDEGDLRPLWPDDVLGVAVDAVHAEGARVTAHTFASESIDPLLEAGIDCIEHGTGMTPEQIQRAAALDVPVVPTLLQIGQFETIADQGEGKFPAFATRMRGMYERRYDQVRDFYDAGVQMYLGTDAGGSIGHGRIADEATEMVVAGVPAAAVTAAATWEARAWLGVPGIAEGASADVVVFGSDPRLDISELAHPRAVILRGTPFAMQ